MRVATLSVVAAAIVLGAAAAPSPRGVFEVVAVRRASDTASTLATQEDDALRRMIGQKIEPGKAGNWLDGAFCSGQTRAAAEPWTNREDPNLSDLQVQPVRGDRRLNASIVIDCGGRAISSIHQVLQVDRRVLVTRTPNGAAYLVLEAPLDVRTARAVERGLMRAGFDPGQADGVIDAATRRAVGRYAQSRGADFAFDQGVLTENLVAALGR